MPCAYARIGSGVRGCVRQREPTGAGCCPVGGETVFLGLLHTGGGGGADVI